VEKDYLESIKAMEITVKKVNKAIEAKNQTKNKKKTMIWRDKLE